jgi:putative heme transporter
MMGRLGRRRAAIARGIAAAAVLLGSAVAVYAERGTLRTGMHAVRHARPGWVAAGIALEALSVAAVILLQHRLLKAAGARLLFTALLATEYVSNAIAVGVPIVGSGIAAATALRHFRERGIDPAALRLILGLGGVISTAVFAVIAATGAVLAGNPAGAGTGLLAGCGSAAAPTVLVIIAHSPRSRAWIKPIAASAQRLTQRITRHPVGDADVIAAGAAGWFGSLTQRPRAIGYLLAGSAVNWTADAACLAAAIGAVGMPVPWETLALAWSAGVGASTISPTPFGLGIVEATLIAALAAAGISSPGAVGAVLSYQVMTFKIAGTLIWLLHSHFQQRSRGDERGANHNASAEAETVVQAPAQCL